MSISIPHVGSLTYSDIMGHLLEARTSALNAYKNIQEQACEAYKTISTQVAEKSVIAKDYAGRRFQEIKASTLQFIEQNKATFLDAAREAEKIAKITFIAVGALFLFLSNSSLFLVGAVCAYFAKDRTRSVLTDITNSWDKSPLAVKTILVAGGILAWPSVFAVGAFLLGGASALYLIDKTTPQPQESNETDTLQASPMQE